MGCIYTYQGKQYSKEEFYNYVKNNLVQPKTVQKYTKILFPTGNTASRIEGHTTLEEFKKQKEDRIKQLEENTEETKRKVKDKSYINRKRVELFYSDSVTDEQIANELIQGDEIEINQLKQELERVEKEGFVALRPIYNFYENTVGNILKKQGYNPKLITDEYNNTWNEVIIDKKRDLSQIQFQKLTAEEKAKTIEQVTKEHRSIVALKDLSAKLAYRIGGKVKFENNPNADWKGYNQGMTSVLNEAYMTPDTPFHEILAHPIIRAIKNRSNHYRVGETAEFHGYGEPYRVTIEKFYEDTLEADVIDENGNKEKVQIFELSKAQNTFLYKSLLKELETGKGKEVFEQVKRDYNRKKPLRDDINNKYTLEEQQEEAIVTLLGMMAADKLDAKKDATLISKLKELWKQISDFVRSLLRQDGIKIDKLPITTTLNDLAEIMAYGNNKIILPGYKVEYQTPLGNKYDTLEEVNNEIRNLANSDIEVDLSGVELKDKNKVNSVDEIKVDDFAGVFEDFIKVDGKWYNQFVFESNHDYSKDTPVSDKEIIAQWNARFDEVNEYKIEKGGLEGFIEKNKEYEQSKEIIEEWKKVNNIQYNPEEIYSRGQGFYSSIGAYSNLELDLLLKNLIQHIEDNKKAGGEFTISAFTKPIDKRLKHIEGTGDRVRFVIYPKSNHIKWAAPTDVYSGSVWDANEKVSKDKKSELLGVSFTKAPALRNINEVSPNLADIIDNLSHVHNELGIELTTNNFRLEYDDNIDYSTKKLIDSINKILDDKYGKLVKPEIKRGEFKTGFEVLNWNSADAFGMETIKFNTKKEAENYIYKKAIDLNINESDFENILDRLNYEIKEVQIPVGKQPKLTKENTTSIESVKKKLNNLTPEQIKELNDKVENGEITDEEEYNTYIFNNLDKINKKEYTSQALINTKIAKLKEVARKYPRSLITSKVVPINPNMVDNSEIQYSKRESIENLQNEKEQKKKDRENINKSPYLKQYVYFKRRLAKLERQQKSTKEDTPAYNIIEEQKSKLEEGIKKVTKDQDYNTYKKLADDTLDYVKQKIEDLVDTKDRKGRPITDDEIIDISDILDTFKNFKGTESLVKEYTEKLFPLIQDRATKVIQNYSTEKNKITKEDINNQNEDIGKFTKGVGSLSDSKNYIGRTIGSIIKEAQNRKSTRAKQLKSRIKEQRNNLNNWAKKNGVSLEETYDLFIQPKENTTMLAQKHLSNGQLNPNFKTIVDNPELSEFYQFYQDTISELQKNQSIKFGKNFIPNLKKTKGIWNKIKELINVQTTSDTDFTSKESLYADVLPTKYTKRLNNEEKSRDLGAILMTYGKHIYNQEEMSDILPTIRLLQENLKYKLTPEGILTERSFKKSSDPKTEIFGSETNLNKMIEDVINMQVFGEMKNKELYFELGNTYDENGNITGRKYVHGSNIIDLALRYNSLLRIGFSPITAASNVIFGDISNFMEAIGGQHFNLTQLKQASNIFIRQTLDKESILNKVLIEELNILQDLEDYNQVTDVSLESIKKLSPEKLIEYAYSMQKSGEKYLQSRPAIAVMIKEGYLSPKGELTDKYKDASDKEKAQLVDKIQRVNQMIHGRYTQQEAATLQQSVLYRLISQFKKWLPTAIENRIGERKYDNRLQTEIEGRYVTIARLLSNFNDTYDRVKSGNLSKLEIANLKKTLTELTLFTATYLALGALKGDDEESKKLRKNWAVKTGLTLLNRVSGDISYFFDPSQISNTSKNLVPLVRTMDDLRLAISYLPSAFGEEGVYKKGSRKGQNKALTKLASGIPGLNQAYQLRRLANKEELEEFTK